MLLQTRSLTGKLAAKRENQAHKLIIPLSIACLFSTGCSMFDEEQVMVEQVDQTPVVMNLKSEGHTYKQPPTDLYKAAPLDKNINFYVRGLMQSLISNLQQVNNKTPVAVSSFIYLDGPENKASLLGLQVAESLLHEIHKAGIPVLDHKVTDYMRVTQSGDFVMTRDFNELTSNIEVFYVFTGNLVKHQGGYLANARVVAMGSKVIVSSAQTFIPAEVADALLDSQTKAKENMVPLKQAD